DNFLLHQRNGNLGQSISPKTSLTLAGPLVRLQWRIAASHGEGSGLVLEQHALRRVTRFFSGAIQMVDRRFGGWRGYARWVGRATVVVAAGCAAIGGNLTSDTPLETKQAVVRERAEARWQAVIKGDYPAAYAYLSPASRGIVSAGTFEARQKGVVTFTGV